MRIAVLILLLFPEIWAQTQPALKCGFADHDLSLMKVWSPQTRDLDFLDESVLSPRGVFRIHFTRSGTHAVSGAESSGIPQFVMEAGIAADSAYSILIDELGFLAPLADGGIDGAELDIYIKNWNGAYYGMTYFGSSAPSITYLVVDNDYTEANYATSGLEALRVTIAHEFFHMVQLRYAYPFEPVSSNAYWYEISSTWMEEKCYPEINDYHAYVTDIFRRTSFPNINDDSFGFAFSYGHGLFGQILDIEYGTQNNKHIMLDIWENIDGKEATDNLVQVLSSSPWGSSLTDALGKYALYNIFTGSRAISNMYYPDAAELDELNLREYDLPQYFPDSIEFFMDVFEISFRKLNIPTYSNFYVRGDVLNLGQRVFLTYHSFDNGSSLKGSVGDYWISCANVSSLDYLIFPMVNGDRESDFFYTLSFEGNTLKLKDKIQTLWPNPSLLNQDPAQLNFMLAEPGDIVINIYDLSGELLSHEKRFSTEGIKVIDLSVPDSSPAGIYFVQIITANSNLRRKFTVLK
ncbi:MAG: T9SS type A sorting domain-containing protein [Candidatus Marinimicrobia bacterium]|nr:T9SS type A sorting domain-containing protein [Candidatus Neomarinimicrobiota bacterium]